MNWIKSKWQRLLGQSSKHGANIRSETDVDSHAVQQRSFQHLLNKRNSKVQPRLLHTFTGVPYLNAACCDGEIWFAAGDRIFVARECEIPKGLRELSVHFKTGGSDIRYQAKSVTKLSSGPIIVACSGTLCLCQPCTRALGLMEIEESGEIIEVIGKQSYYEVRCDKSDVIYGLGGCEYATCNQITVHRRTHAAWLTLRTISLEHNALSFTVLNDAIMVSLYLGPGNSKIVKIKKRPQRQIDEPIYGPFMSGPDDEGNVLLVDTGLKVLRLLTVNEKIKNVVLRIPDHMRGAVVDSNEQVQCICQKVMPRGVVSSSGRALCVCQSGLTGAVVDSTGRLICVCKTLDNNGTFELYCFEL